MKILLRHLREIRDSLNDLVTNQLTLLAVEMTLSDAGWRTSGTPAEDVKRLVEAWADAERRAAR